MTQTLETASGTSAGLGVTEALARYVAEMSYDQLPAAAVHKAKLLIRDGLGNQLGASTIAEPARVAHELVAEFGGTPQATVTGYGTRLPVPWAAMLNAMLGHGIELDDAHANALTKSGSLLIPTVMTTGEYLRRSGAETITAAVVGYDLMVRIGLAINPGHRQRGFHTTGVVGAIASAGAAARQFRYDTPRVADALGLGAMQAAGLQAYLDYPCMAKPLSPGKAAMNGTLAAMLVSKGFTGPRHALESREGFFNGYAEEVNLDGILTGLGSDLKIMEVGFKPHAACRYAHGPIDAAQLIREAGDFTIDDIATVQVRLCSLAIRQSGRNEVPNLNAAMGSTPFGVALALTRGRNGLNDYAEGFEDPRLHDIAKAVELVAEPEYGTMGRQAVVQVRLTNGEVLERAVRGPKGEPDLPMSDDELEAKFLGLAELAIGEARARELNEQIMTLEDVDDVAVIVRGLHS